MGISRGAVKLILDECSARSFDWAVLQLGRQDLHFSISQPEEWRENSRVVLREISEPRKDCTKGPLRKDIDDVEFFTILGFDSVASADLSDYEKPSLTLDLNKPVPSELQFL